MSIDSIPTVSFKQVVANWTLSPSDFADFVFTTQTLIHNYKGISIVADSVSAFRRAACCFADR
jgi:hypothetical protein